MSGLCPTRLQLPKLPARRLALLNLVTGFFALFRVFGFVTRSPFAGYNPLGLGRTPDERAIEAVYKGRIRLRVADVGSYGAAACPGGLDARSEAPVVARGERAVGALWLTASSATAAAAGSDHTSSLEES